MIKLTMVKPIYVSNTYCALPGYRRRISHKAQDRTLFYFLKQIGMILEKGKNRNANEQN